MNYADTLPEDADDLVTVTNCCACICVWERIPDPDDLEDAALWHRYPATLLKITYVMGCKYADHSSKAIRGEHRLLKFVDNGTTQDVE